MSSDLPQTAPSYGRPTLCNEETTRLYCKAVRKHLPQHLCAAYAGVSADAVQAWVRKGIAGEEPYATFAWKVAQTKARMAGVLTGRISQASRNPREWRAAMALLQKMYLDVPLVELPAGALVSTNPDVITAGDLSDPERVLLARIERIQGALTAAQGARSHMASSQLSRDLDRAVAELAELRKAAQTSPADQDEQTFLELLSGAAEQMPEDHLRVLVDTYCRRHRVTLVRDPRWQRDESGEWFLADEDDIETVPG